MKVDTEIFYFKLQGADLRSSVPSIWPKRLKLAYHGKKRLGQKNLTKGTGRRFQKLGKDFKTHPPGIFASVILNHLTELSMF